jgi:hypothetical protein
MTDLRPGAAGDGAHRYQPFYCEENAWWLSQAPELGEHARFLLFVSNPGRTVAMWGQRAAPEGQPVVWDYHAIVLSRPGPEAPALAWDLDARLDLPVPGEAWIAASFPEAVPEALAPRFRLVPHAEVLATFASDRRHMRTDDGWQAEPPPWPCIVSRGGAVHTLDAFVDVEGAGPGEVLDLDGLRRWVAGAEPSGAGAASGPGS